MIIEFNDNDGDQIEHLAEKLGVDPRIAIKRALHLLSIGADEEGKGNQLAVISQTPKVIHDGNGVRKKMKTKVHYIIQGITGKKADGD